MATPRDPSFQLESEFGSEVEGKDESPKIRGVVMLECGVILATDWENCVIKGFDITGKFLDDCYIALAPGAPERYHGLTLKDANTVYVTLPTMRKIVCVTVSHVNDKVDFLMTGHDTNRRYYGIAHMAKSKQLVVGTSDTVDILSYTCRKLMGVKCPQFTTPYNMGVESEGSVLVSDTKQNCVFRLTAQEHTDKPKVERLEMEKRYLQLRGITSDSRGNIYLGAEARAGVAWLKDDVMMGWVQANKVKAVVGIHFQQTHTGNWLVVAQLDGIIKVFRVTYK